MTDNPRFEPGVFEDMTVQAEFERITYTLTYTAGAGGHLEVNEQPQQSPYAVQLPEGESVTVTAVPETGYVFAGWSDGVETATRTDADVQGDIDVTAEFERITYTLTYSAEAGGAVFGQASQTVGYGESGTRVTAVPAAGYTFVKWSDDVETATRTDTDVQGDIDVTAEFMPVNYTLNYSAEAGGIVTGTAEQSVAYGESGAQVTAVPDAGYEFAGWSDGVETAGRTDTAWADLFVSARFEPDETSAVTVTYEAQTDENGVALGTVAGARVQRLAPGQNGAPVTALPAAGYVFAGWSDGETDATRSDSAEKSVTFTALFEPAAETDLFAGGTGTADDPFLIADLRQLRNIQVQETGGSYEDSKKYYKLTDDIVLGAGAPNFVPLDMTGQYETQNNSYFRGHLDGGGHSIKNLHIVAPGGTAALFVGIAEGSVKNLNIVNAYIAGTEKVAGIAGTVYNGQVVGCRVQGTLKYLPGPGGEADAAYIGGVAGAFTVTYISEGILPFDGCSADVTICARDVAGTAYAGGAVGSADITGKNAGPMSLSAEAAIYVFARGEVYAGGLAGYARSALSLQNSTFAGTIEAACRAEPATPNGAVVFVGGLVGNGELSSSLTLQNCTAEGTFTVYGDGAALGGLVGAAAGLAAADSGFDGALRVFCGQVAGAVDAGGIAATVNGDCTVVRCSAAGTIAIAAGEEDNGSAVRAGGLLGRVTNGDLIVGDSYACTTISLGVEYAFAGGLLGQASAGDNAAGLEFCYAAGGIVDLPASGHSSLGACVGIGDGTDVMNVHWLQGRGASAAVGGGIGQEGFVGHAAEGEITAGLLNDGRVGDDAPWQEGADGLPVLVWESEAAQARA